MFKIKNILILFFVMLFLGCKKYPENELWFDEPKKVFKGGKITSYTMSGIDQMQIITDMYKNFPYNYYGTSLPDVFLLPYTYDSGADTISTNYGSGLFKFTANKMEIEIGFIPKNAGFGAKNIFLTGLNWKILKLTSNGQLKIQAQYNERVYEVQFN